MKQRLAWVPLVALAFFGCMIAPPEGPHRPAAARTGSTPPHPVRPATAAAPAAPAAARRVYPVHRDITATVFWVGEPAAKNSPSNAASAWDDRWQEHFGGFDDPNRRSGYRPAAFEPKENPFYVALPYHDLPGGRRRPDALRVIPWAADGPPPGRRQSLCKNRWVRVTRGDRTCYAQWADVGPFRTDDADYVFGAAAPANRSNRAAGIDVSPAVRDFLGLGGTGAVDWQFVDEAGVPDGPWKRVVTRGGIHWE